MKLPTNIPKKEQTQQQQHSVPKVTPYEKRDNDISVAQAVNLAQNELLHREKVAGEVMDKVAYDQLLQERTHYYKSFLDTMKRELQ